MTQIDTFALRDAFGSFMTGVTVVTMIDDSDRPLGFTANSFASVSLDPPLLLVSIANSSANLTAFRNARGFAVNILSEGQKDISATFARPVADRFSTVYWRRGPVGAPLIAGVSAWFDCTLDQAIPAGDHTILLGRIGGFAAMSLPGLGYYRGAYITPAATAQELPAGPDVVLSAIIEQAGRVLLVDDERGGLSVPMVRVGRDGVQAALAGVFARLRIKGAPGSVYAVYEDARLGTQHLALRCPVGADCTAAAGAFVDLDPEAFGDITDPALRAMLQRLAEETRLGNFGTYFGSHEQGRVARIAEGRTR
jgi:flavin-dependent trigonelline monooxygenase, reductase component